VAVAALEEVVGNRERVALREIERGSSDADVGRAAIRGGELIDRERQAGHLRKGAVRRRKLRDAVVERGKQRAAGDAKRADHVAERMERDERAARERAGGIDAVAANAARVD